MIMIEINRSVPSKHTEINVKFSYFFIKKKKKNEGYLKSLNSSNWRHFTRCDASRVVQNPNFYVHTLFSKRKRCKRRYTHRQRHSHQQRCALVQLTAVKIIRARRARVRAGAFAPVVALRLHLTCMYARRPLDTHSTLGEPKQTSGRASATKKRAGRTRTKRPRDESRQASGRDPRKRKKRKKTERERERRETRLRTH